MPKIKYRKRTVFIFFIALALLLIPCSDQDSDGFVSALDQAQLAYTPNHPYFEVPYSVNPSFSTTVDYDFSIYDVVPGYMHRLERCRDDLDCIIGNVSLIEEQNPGFNWLVQYGGNVISMDSFGSFEYPAWQAYCENPDQHAVNSLAEAVDACSKSADRVCSCQYRLPIVTQEDIDRSHAYGFSAGLTMFPGVGTVLGIISFIATALSDSGDWEERVISLSQSGRDIRISMLSPGTPASQIVSGAHFKELSDDLANDGGSFAYEIGDAGSSVYIKKDSHNNITIASSTSENPCEIHSKLVKFCIVQNKSFFAYDSSTNRMGIQQQVLKFAYLFSADITDVKNFEVRDAKLASNISLLVWDAVSGVDVDYYTIYHSPDFSLLASLRDASPQQADIAALDIKAKRLYADDLSRDDVQIKKESLLSPLCDLEGATCTRRYSLESETDITASEQLYLDALYFSPLENKFFYFLDNVNNDQRYFFAITATDTNGDESPSFTLPSDSNHDNSVDDIPPGFAEIRSAEVGGDSRVFITLGEIKNIDGSTLDASAITKFNIYCFDPQIQGAVVLSQPDVSQRPRILEDGSLQVSAYIDELCPGLGYQQARVVVAGVKGLNTAYAGPALISSLPSVVVALS